jgi:hypothetical protein
MPPTDDLRLLPDQVRGFFIDHCRRCMGVAGNDPGHDRCVDDPHVVGSDNPQFRIDNGIRLIRRPQAAGSDRVMGRAEAPAQHSVRPSQQYWLEKYGSKTPDT